MMLNQTGVFSTAQVALQMGDRQQAMASHKISRSMPTLTPPRRDTRLGHLGHGGMVHGDLVHRDVVRGGDRHFCHAPGAIGQAPVVHSSPPAEVGIRPHHGEMGWVVAIHGFQHWRFALHNQRVA